MGERPGQVAMFLMLMCLGCSRGASRAERANVLLISIDSLRADHLGCYGYERDTSPTIDRLAAEGVRYTGAVSSTSWTLPAHASMFTGLPPSAHGCNTAAGLHTGHRTLAETLREQGYDTAGFWSGPHLHPAFRLDQGFDTYVNCASHDFERPRSKRAALAHDDVTGPKILAEVELWLEGYERNEERPFFLFVHMWDVHYHYLPPSPYDTLFDPEYTGPIDGRRPGPEGLIPRDLEHLIALYDGEIAWTDRHVQGILDALERHAVLDETLILLTSDHGEEFYEHGRFGHRKTLYEESIAVPLILRYPGRIPAGSQVEGVVSVTDIPATILDFLGLEPIPDTGGRSLLPLLDDSDQPREMLAISELFRQRTHWLSVRSEGWKILVNHDTGSVDGWWNLQADPDVTHNLAKGPLSPDVERTVKEARRKLLLLAEQHQRQPEEERSLPDELEETLRELGYVGEDE
ncbi:MAG: hypothetical protein CMJ89_15865 [Planctomycetes bacterium]|jgi:arylsulfatase A-like enzyme|nr:hypothetical protein [Planctomycetota bacterium]